MKKTKSLLFAIACILSLAVSAQERSETEMLSIAQSKLNIVSAKAMTPGQANETAVQKLESGDTYNIYGANEQGFVIISKDKRFAPVLAYSNSNYSKDRMPCGFKLWLAAVNNAMSSTDGITDMQKTTSFNGGSVESFVKTQWGQGSPYNDKAPKDGGQETPSGCVATAMAQVLKYYQYPTQGKGSGYYTVGASTTRVPQAISSVYDWENMTNTYGVTSTDVQKEAVATLMNDAAVATHMNFASSGSGAISSDAALGFATNFSYDSLSMHFYNRDYYTDDEWNDMMYSELAQQKPIFFAASDKQYGGHAYVLDGYDSDGKVHVNWGWDGTADGYYDLNAMNPTGILGYNMTYAFNYNQRMLVGMKCQEQPDADESYMSQIVGDSIFTCISQMRRSLNVGVDAIYNMSFLTFRGTVSVYVENTETGEIAFKQELFNTSSASVGPLASNYGWGLGSKFFMMSSIKEGTYKVYLVSQAIQEDTPQMVRYPGGQYYYIIEVASDGKITISDAQQPTTGIRNLTTSDSNSDANVRVFDATGRLIHSANAATFNIDNVPSRGLLIIKQGASVKKIMKK